MTVGRGGKGHGYPHCFPAEDVRGGELVYKGSGRACGWQCQGYSPNLPARHTREAVLANWPSSLGL